jgi:hypothetical protein
METDSGTATDAIPPMTATPGFVPLQFDLELLEAPPAPPGKRWVCVAWILAALVWGVVGLLYETGNPPAILDAVWYAAAALTVSLGGWLVVVLVRTARTEGVGTALRWLVS